MATQISKGHTYNPGDVVDAADLNALVDNATALVGLITEQGAPVTALGSDQVIINRAGTLHRANVSTMPFTGTVTSVTLTVAPTSVLAVTGTNPITGAGTFGVGLVSQTANKVLAGPTTGSGVPSFRLLAPTDIPIATVTIAALDINWDLGSSFIKTLSANCTFTFSNTNEGQTIRVALIQVASYTVAWPGTVRWKNGTAPVMSVPAGRTDFYTFHKFGGVFYGTFDQNFHT